MTESEESLADTCSVVVGVLMRTIEEGRGEKDDRGVWEWDERLIKRW